MKKAFILFILFIGVYFPGLLAVPHTPDVSRTQPLPLCFIENKGQLRNTADEPLPQLRYQVKAPGMTVFVANNSLHYTFAKPDRVRQSMDDTTPVSYHLQQMELVLEGANTHALIEAKEQQEYYENYYGPGYGPDGITEVHSYGRLVVKDVYPHIDWVLYTSGGRLKYDFVVKQSGSAADIRLRYKGADRIVKNEDGSITAITPLGSITEDAPIAFAAGSKKQVPSAFVLEGDLLRFDMKGYNGPVVIDPTLSWATYYGGSDGDNTHSITCDGAGNVYLAGITFSTNNIATPGSFQSVFSTGSGQDGTGYVVKFDGNGVRQWATYYRGVAYVYTNLSVATDGNNNVYLAGETETAGMSTPGSFQPVLNVGRDAFLAKFNSGGVRQWATYFGGGGSDGAHAVACDGANNVYITGEIGSGNMATPGAHQPTPGGGWDAFLVKFSPAGQRLWSTYYGGSNTSASEERGTSLVCDGSYIYMAGKTSNFTGIATSPSQQPGYGGGLSDHFLVKFDGNGVRQWGTYMGGSNAELNGPYIAKDEWGDIYMAGDTHSPDNIASPGSHQPTKSGYQDMYLVKFNSNGYKVWGTYFGGSGYDIGRAVACDHTDGVYLLGGAAPYSGIVPPSTGLAYPLCNYQDTPTASGSTTTVLAKFNTSGTRLWSTYYGGDNVYLHTLAISPQNDLYAAGSTNLATGFSTPGVHQPVFGGVYDAVLMKFIKPTLRITSSMNTSYCPGATFTLQYTTDLSFASNNVFAVQLSDANSGWTNPVNIGSITSSTSGSIACTIPANTPPGNNYRVRLVASNPQAIAPAACPAFIVHPVVIPTLTATGPTTVCAGTAVVLTASGGTPGNYIWRRDGNIIAGASGSTYSATVSGNYTVEISNGICTGSSNTITVVVNQVPVAAIYPANDTIICSGTSYTLIAPAGTGYSYVWLRNGNIIPGATAATYAASLAGTYRVAVHALPCPSDTSAGVNITLKPTPPAPAVTPVYNYCPGDVAVPLQATGQNLLWYYGSMSATPQATAPVPSTASPNTFIWYVTQTGTNGCESPAATITVNVHAKPQPPVVTDLFLCTDDVPQALTATGQGLLWYANATGGTGSAAAPVPNTAVAGTTTYYVSQTVNGCESDRAAIVVDVAEKAIAAFTVSRDTVCQGDTLTLLASGPNAAGTVYTWTTGGADIISGAGQGPVVIRTRDAGVRVLKLQVTNRHCTATEIHEIYVRPAREFLFYLPGDACPGDTISLDFDRDPSWTYSWDFDGATIIDSSSYSRYWLSWPTPGTKAVSMQVTRLNACPALLEPRYVQVHELPPASIEHISSGDICSGDQVQLRANYNDSFTYKWTPERFFTNTGQPWEPIATVRKTGYIILAVTDQWGCRGYDSVYVQARPCCDIFLPDGFTPNGDGLNDIFHILTPGHHQLSAFRVVNRWGEVVFSTLDQGAGWDGRYKGVPQDAGTYYYQVKYRCDDGRVYEKKGDVVLVR